ncbi:MAG TPA: hypothetical protein VFE47_14120 [Tepidisphaeraceae bacterium]|jgi:hypothetical protein|nr:hypothetical protein [Tepidisphaeraceae bacterium]
MAAKSPHLIGHCFRVTASSRLGVLYTTPILLALTLPGCTHPSADNIRLRKLNQDLQAKIDNLTTQNDSKQRIIDGLMQRIPTIPTLPPKELKNFWIPAGLKFGRFTGGVQIDATKPGDDGLRVYICPTDEFGTPIQVPGSFVVEAFDLAEKGDNRLGRWTWDSIAAKSQWRSFLLEFGYELTCPWQKIPKRSDITVRVTFTDELTHTPITAEEVAHANIPPSPQSAPTTAPSR